MLHADPVVEIKDLSLASVGGHLIPAPGGAYVSPEPFRILLSNSSHDFTATNLGTTVPIDELVLRVGYETNKRSVSEIQVDLWFQWSLLGGEPVPGKIAEGVFCTPMAGDFNRDGLVDVADTNLLGSAIADPNPDFSFDLNGDDQLNQDDLEFFLSGDFITSGNKLNGDADFSGFVGFPDYLVLSSNFGEDNQKWSEGDFVANGRVEFEDYLVLSANFAQFPMAAEAVPEPSGLLPLALALGLYLARTAATGRSPLGL